jgi:hypothetical protein
MRFENIEQAKECLECWQKILYLTDWIICIKFEEIDEGLCANITTAHSLKTATIRIQSKEDEELRTMKNCVEHTLIHELLHIILDLSGRRKKSLEEAEFHEANHQRVEMISRSLLMAKYNLSPEWFKN